jgi:GT2 family glycosyltransferase
MTTENRQPRIVAVILNWNGRQVLQPALESLLVQDWAPEHVIVVDNDSSDESPAMVSRIFPQVQLLCSSQNLGYAGGCNAGISEAAKYQPDFVLLLNNDVLLTQGLVGQLVREAQSDSRIGVLAPSVRRVDRPSMLDSAYGRIRFHHVIADRLGESAPADSAFAEAKDVDCVFGAVLLVRLEVFSRAGGFDEDFWMFLEEVEFCFRARKAGFRIRYFPAAQALHHSGHSTDRSGISHLRTYLVRRNSVLFMKKHGTFGRWCRFLSAVAASLMMVAVSSLLRWNWMPLLVRWRGYRDGMLGRKGIPSEMIRLGS